MTRLSAFTLTILLPSVVVAAPPAFNFYDLGNLGSQDWTWAYGVNDLGLVVADTSNPEKSGIPVSWCNGVMTDLSVVCGVGKDVFGTARAISRWGTIAGGGWAGGDGCCAVVCISDDVIAFDIPPECETNNEANAINAAGTIAVGSCWDNIIGLLAPVVHCVEDGSSIYLGYPPEFPPAEITSGIAYGVNDSGVVLLRICNYDGCWAYVWTDGVMTKLANEVGGSYISAYGINKASTIVGWAETPNGGGAMMYKDGVMSIMGDGTAHAVNDRNWAAGNDNLDLIDEHAMLYKDGETIDLDPFLPAGMSLTWATGINNYGWVVGNGYDFLGRTHGWLLVPIYDKGDFDGDEDVDLQDFGHFQRCFAAEPYIDGTLHVGCSVFDFDDDVDLDLVDYAAFQAAFTGPMSSEP